MKKTSFASFASALLVGSALLSPTAAARPMTPTDLATLKRLNSPAVSPNERWAAFSVTETDATSFDRDTGLYLLDLQKPKAAPVRIADMPETSEHSPAFSADGKSLYFLSDASGSEQLWRIAIDDDGADGKAQQSSNLQADIAGFKLSPAGNKLAVWGDIAKDCPTFGCDEANGGGGNRAEPGPGTGREYDELFVRHWSSWETPGNYSRIFAFDLTDGEISTAGVAMDGDLVGDSPSKPFGGGEEISWSSDGEDIIFAMRIADNREPKSTNLDLYLNSTQGDKLTNITSDNLATDTLPAISPESDAVAWAAMKRPSYESDKLTVKVMRKPSSEVKDLTADWDRSVYSIAWTPDSRKLVVTTQEVLDHPAYEVDAVTGDVKRLTGEGNVGNVIPLKDGSIVYTLNNLQEPNDLYRKAPASAAVRLTNVNETELANIDKITVKRFKFKGANGDDVWGQIIKPASKPGGGAGKLPMAFLVHGGPQGSFGNSWSTRWNPKVMASQGFAVVTIDFHGSIGYGQKFTDSINQDWGGKPLEDLKLGFAAALKEDKQIDGDRACALGASYGGYMMNWIAGNWPDRFDCIVNHAGIFDLRSFAFSTEELWFDQWDHGGPWWKRANPEKWNPVNHIEKWKTPTLFIHGEKDFRIPYTQSIMPFTYAQEAGIESKLLIFPDENHWVLKGKNSVQWHETVFEWMKKYTIIK